MHTHHASLGFESLYFPTPCWGPKCDKEAHSMKSKKGPLALTKECPTCEVKKDHERPKAQKEGKWKKKKVKKKRT